MCVHTSLVYPWQSSSSLMFSWWGPVFKWLAVELSPISNRLFDGILHFQPFRCVLQGTSTAGGTLHARGGCVLCAWTTRRMKT